MPIEERFPLAALPHFRGEIVSKTLPSWPMRQTL
jgi:hypothetical protein